MCLVVLLMFFSFTHTRKPKSSEEDLETESQMSEIFWARFWNKFELVLSEKFPVFFVLVLELPFIDVDLWIQNSWNLYRLMRYAMCVCYLLLAFLLTFSLCVLKHLYTCSHENFLLMSRLSLNCWKNVIVFSMLNACVKGVQQQTWYLHTCSCLLNKCKYSFHPQGQTSQDPKVLKCRSVSHRLEFHWKQVYSEE